MKSTKTTSKYSIQNLPKKIKLFSYSLLLLGGFFIFTNFSAAEEKSVIISAVQISGTDSNDDFIELHNPTCANIDLSDWKIKKRTKSGSESSIGSLKNIIPAKGYYLWENTSKNLADNPDYSTKTYYLANDYSLAIYNKDEKQIDSITWGENTSPFSPTQSYPTNPAKLEALLRSTSNEFSILPNYSPKNSTFPTAAELEKCPPPEKKSDSTPKTYSTTVYLNELLPNPAAGMDEFIELYNPSQENIDLTDWILRDGSKTGKYIFPKDSAIKPQAYLVVYKKDFKFALNNSGAESVSLYDPTEKIVSTTTYSGTKKDLSYNFDASNWRWSKFLTPGAENVFNNLPTAKNNVPKKVYVNMYADFSADGSDKDRDALKYTWDFGDGHKSYLATTKHKYENTGTFTVTLKITDGSEDTIKTFEIKVEKFPKLDVKIVSLSPNPSGTDTGAEFLNILNTTKKKINLNGWSIASGTKTLANHPITVDFFINPKAITKLTYEISKFTLPNTNVKIELRYPNGDVASKVKYKSLSKTVVENATYEKTKSGWKWNVPPIETSSTEELSSDQANAVQELSSLATPPTPSEENQPASEPEEVAPDPEVVENLGKFSQSESLKNKKKARFSLLNLGFHIKTAQAFSENIPARNFTLEEPTPQKSWINIFLDSANAKTNDLLNKIF